MKTNLFYKFILQIYSTNLFYKFILSQITRRFKEDFLAVKKIKNIINYNSF